MSEPVSQTGAPADLVASVSLHTVALLLAALAGCVFLGFAGWWTYLWLRCLLAGAHVAFWRLVRMRLIGVRPEAVVGCLVRAARHGIRLDVQSLQALYLAGCDLPRVTEIMIAARKKEIQVSFERAAGLEMMGLDVMKAVQEAPRGADLDEHLSEPRRRESSYGLKEEESGQQES